MKNTGAMGRLIDGLLDVMWPRMCPCCGRVLMQGERIMCLHCRVALPLTNFHNTPTDNELRSKLNGLEPIERAAAYFHYQRDSTYAALIHDAKYRERPRLARDLGEEYARIISTGGFFDGMDAIVPVPLNFWKECSRGYNQSAWIARGVARVIGLPVIGALTARRHATQTHKDALERRRNVESVYFARPEALKGLSHVLLVDDVATTGATLYACAKAVHEANPGVKVSVFVLAAAR